MSIRVLVADDHAIVRRGIIQIVTEDSGITIAGEAEKGDEVLSLARDTDWDVLILDLNMPGSGGLSVLAQLHAEHPERPILVLSIHDEEQYGPRVIKAGAAGFLAKSSAPAKLVEAVRHVASGHRYVSLSLAEALLDRMEAGDDEPHRQLSDREFEVFHALASGSTASEIAERLSLSVKTISTYRTRVLEKLGMRTNADLARYAVEKDLL